MWRTAVVGLALPAAALLEPTAARAATTAGLRAQADEIAAQVTADNANLRVIGLHYLAAQSSYMGDIARAKVLGRSLGNVERSVNHARSLLQETAISAYVNAGSLSQVGLYLAGQPDTISQSNTYLDVATGRLSSMIGVLAGDEHQLTVTLTAEQHATVAAHLALDQATTDRDTALSTLSAEQTTLTSVSGQLATLVAQQAAAAERAAEARAAAAAAAAAAAQAATSTSAPTPGTPSATPPSAGAGPPSTTSVASLNPGAPPASLAGDFAAIRNCESGGNYAENTGNGYYGAYQFSASTWTGLGGSGLASQASPAAQDAAAYRLYQSSGWSAWPECAAIAGL